MEKGEEVRSRGEGRKGEGRSRENQTFLYTRNALSLNVEIIFQSGRACLKVPVPYSINQDTVISSFDMPLISVLTKFWHLHR